jgi:hypothetical protein
MKRRTLILTIDFHDAPEWHIRAKQKQMADWIDQNKTLLPYEDLIILPAPGDTKLYWLEGKNDDIKTLDNIKDKLLPVLSVSLDVSANKTDIKLEVEKLKQYRMNNAKHIIS